MAGQRVKHGDTQSGLLVEGLLEVIALDGQQHLVKNTEIYVLSVHEFDAGYDLVEGCTLLRSVGRQDTLEEQFFGLGVALLHLVCA